MRFRWRVTGGTAALVALAVLASGPALAAAPSSVVAAKPTWSSSQLKAGGSFKNTVSALATYNYTLQLVRTSTSTKPTCTTASGCLTSISGTQVQLSSSGMRPISVAKSSTATIPSLVVNCTTSSTTRYYWTWLKVADSSGNAVVSLSSSLAGKYC